MTQAISTVLVRLFAAYCMLTAFVYSWQIMAMAERVAQQEASFLVETNIPWAIMGISGALLWWFSHSIGRWISGASNSQEATIAADDIVAAGSFIIGLYWVIDTLPYAMGLSIAYWQLSAEYGSVGSTFYLREMAPVWTQAIIGLLIMFGTRNLVRLFRIIRPNVVD